MLIHLLAQTAGSGFTSNLLTKLSGFAGLLIVVLVLWKMDGGFSFKKLAFAALLGFATVATIAASPQIGAAAWRYGSSGRMVSDIAGFFGSDAPDEPIVVEASAND